MELTTEVMSVISTTVLAALGVVFWVQRLIKTEMGKMKEELKKEITEVKDETHDLSKRINRIEQELVAIRTIMFAHGLVLPSAVISREKE